MLKGIAAKLAAIAALVALSATSFLAQGTSAGSPSIGATTISVGYDLACAVTTLGAVTCWGGQNGVGALGNNIESGWVTRPQKTHILGASSTDTLEVGGDGSHTCALTATGGVKCWGYNAFGQLGDDTTTERHTPVAVCDDSSCAGELDDIEGITTAMLGQFSCALADSGTILCWGKNDTRQLGEDTAETCTYGMSNIDCSTTPIQVEDIDDATMVSAGGHHACAIVDEDAVSCWGSNLQGQLGNNQPGEDEDDWRENPPSTPTGLDEGVVGVAAGFAHTCALMDDTSVKCWGDARFGQAGIGDPNDLTETCENPLNPAWADVACALTPVTVCETSPSPEPDLPSDPCSSGDSNALTGVVALSAGFYHTCALMNDDTVKCWGQSEAGQLGDGTICDPGEDDCDGDLFTVDEDFIEIYPVDVLYLDDIEQVAAGYHNSCARSDTEVWCWGENHRGAIGDGTEDDSGEPVETLFDTDRDGCYDDAEDSLSPSRDPTDPWDYYDVVDGNGDPQTDGVIDSSNDLAAVQARYSPSGYSDPSYAHYDRSSGGFGPPDGVIDLSNDILGVAGQVGDNCT